MVVAIIAISAAVAAPSLSEAMAIRRANESTHAMVRIGARARSSAMLFGRAHVLSYSQNSFGPGGDNGRVELWRGRVDRCTANAWGTIMAGGCAGNVDCVDELNMGTYAYPTHRVQMRLPGATTGMLCFQPDGDMFVSIDGSPFATNVPVGGGVDGIRFTFQRTENGSNVDVLRRVVFPFGGSPRIDR